VFTPSSLVAPTGNEPTQHKLPNAHVLCVGREREKKWNFFCNEIFSVHMCRRLYSINLYVACRITIERFLICQVVCRLLVVWLTGLMLMTHWFRLIQWHLYWAAVNVRYWAEFEMKSYAFEKGKCKKKSLLKFFDDLQLYLHRFTFESILHIIYAINRARLETLNWSKQLINSLRHYQSFKQHGISINCNQSFASKRKFQQPR